MDLENTVYALDSTTIDLSLTPFPWADFRQAKSGIKLHTQIDLRGPIPTHHQCPSAQRELDQQHHLRGWIFISDGSRLHVSRSDHEGKPTLPRSRKAFPVLLKRIRHFNSKTGKELILLTNNLKTPALTVAMFYKPRWSIELFFRWIKGHLRIKHYYDTSPNAVKIQI